MPPFQAVIGYVPAAQQTHHDDDGGAIVMTVSGEFDPINANDAQNVGVCVTSTSFALGPGVGLKPGSGIVMNATSAQCPIVDGNGEHGEMGEFLSSNEGNTPTWAAISTSFIENFNSDVVTAVESAGKTAVVPSVDGNYVDLYCAEAPDVRFEDVVSIKTNGKLKIEHEIDREFVFVCEPDSIKAVGHTTTQPALCGVKVKENKLIITFSGSIPEEVTIKLSGIRKGFKDVRFTPKTKEQADHNNDFWGQAKL